MEIPTKGVVACNGTDGQILLSYGLFGFFTDFKPKFTKRYANLTEVAIQRLKKNPNCLGWGYKIKYQLSLKSLKNFFQCINQAN